MGPRSVISRSASAGHARPREPHWVARPRADVRGRVLLGEDDATFRGLLAGRLSSSGYAVAEASDGAQLLERLVDSAVGPSCRPDGYDLVITDVRMPGISGSDVLEYLRAGPWSGVPVILMTAFGDDAVHEAARRHGVLLVLEKPFSPDAMVSRVRAILG